MIDELFFIEKITYKKSLLHSLDARVKLLITLVLILVTALLPSPQAISISSIFLISLLLLWIISSLPLSAYLRRLCLIIPFGLFIGLSQLFFGSHSPLSEPILTLPYNLLPIYPEPAQSCVHFLLKFLVSSTAIIILSSTTKTHDLLEGAARMGLPTEFSLMLGLMIRYLFVFGYMFRKIRDSLATRCFDPFDSSLSYRYRVRQCGYLIGTLFIRSYDQGERVYTSMLCRGYGKGGQIFLREKALTSREIGTLTLALLFIILLPLFSWMGALTLR